VETKTGPVRETNRGHAGITPRIFRLPTVTRLRRSGKGACEENQECPQAVPYYYKPYPTYASYHYHYGIYYPSQPRYVYYYNPYSRHYWGRFDTEGKEGEQYALLAEKGREEQRKDVPESAFPKPGAMPPIPEAKDGVAIEPPPKELPKGGAKDLPKDKDKK
jgi:hypothetical protein